MELLVRLESHATQRPDSPAVRTSSPRAGISRTVCYCELLNSVRSMATELDERCPEGAVVALACPTSAEFVIGYLATLFAGRIVHPIPQGSSRAELSGFLRTAGAAVLIGDPASLGAATEAGIEMMVIRLPRTAGSLEPLETARHARSSAAHDTGLYLPSSGTTGLPKIAVRSRGALDAVAANVSLAAGLGSGDVVLAAVPMSHSYGMENGFLGPIWAGSCIDIVERAGGDFDVGELLMEILSGTVSVLPAVPFMVDILAKLAPASGVKTSLRSCYTAGSPLPAAVAKSFRQAFGLGVGQLYGATELGSVTFAAPDECDDPLAVGRPLSGVSILILDEEEPRLDRHRESGVEGQVAIRAASMLSCYLGGDRSAFIGDYFLTGDLGCINADGSLTITGRLKLLIDVGGFKVNPLEVEKTLLLHPSIAEAVVVPIAVTDTVSRLRAIVTPAMPGMPVPIEEVRALVRASLAAHKVPRIIEVVDRLPKSPTGKILRRQLESRP